MKKMCGPITLCALFVFAVLVTGCSKKSFKECATDPKCIAAAVTTGLVAGAHYFKDAFGMKKHIGCSRKKKKNNEVPPTIEEKKEAVESKMG